MGRLGFTVIAVLALAPVACLDAAVEAPLAARPGPHRVVITDDTWRDAARQRPVPVRVYRPDIEQPAPLVVFSHGLGGSREVYAFIGRYLAGHGYVCIHPQHAGTDAKVWEQQGLAVMLLNAADPAQRVARVADLRFVIDHALRDPDLAIHIDPQRLAVGGHSLGAYAALALAGQAVAVPGEPDQVDVDPRVDAVFVLSPLGGRQLGLHPRSWDGVTTPFLAITGTEDVTVGTADWNERRDPFAHAPATPRIFAVIAGVRHHAFGDYDFAHAPVRRDPRHHPWMLAMIHTFLDARLRNTEGMPTWFTQVPERTKGEITIEFAAP